MAVTADRHSIYPHTTMTPVTGVAVIVDTDIFTSPVKTLARRK